MNYGELKTQFSAILNRRDCSTALAETFINQAIIRAQRDLRSPGNESLYEYTVDTNWEGAPVPSDYLQMISMSCDGYPLEFKPYDAYLKLNALSGQPIYWTRYRSKFLLWPTPGEDAVVRILYYGELTTLVADGDTNALTDSASDLIIYGALSYAADYFLDDRRDAFEARYNQIRDDLAYLSYDADGPGVIQPAYSLGDY
jgi:hypothetical protein